jgi:hypothetical protein
MQDAAAIAITGYDAEVYIGKFFSKRFQIKRSEEIFDHIDDRNIHKSNLI